MPTAAASLTTSPQPSRLDVHKQRVGATEDLELLALSDRPVQHDAGRQRAPQLGFERPGSDNVQLRPAEPIRGTGERSDRVVTKPARLQHVAPDQCHRQRHLVEPHLTGPRSGTSKAHRLAPTIDHLRIDGYRNGWAVDARGDLDLLIEYVPARAGQLAIRVSLLAAVTAAAMGWFGRSRRRAFPSFGPAENCC